MNSRENFNKEKIWEPIKTEDHSNWSEKNTTENRQTGECQRMISNLGAAVVRINLIKNEKHLWDNIMQYLIFS